VATLADLLIKVGISADGVDKGSSEIESKLSKSWGKVKMAAAAGGALAGAALMAGISSVIETSKPMALLEAQIGAGSPLAKDAGEVAGDVYMRGVVGSIEEATGAVKAALHNGLVPEDATKAEIAEVANSITDLSAIMEEDAGRVSTAVSQMIRTGLVDSAQEGFDLLVRGTQQGINKSEDLLDTFNEYGVQFEKLGLDGPRAMGLLGQAIKAGARDSDTAADALKEFSIRAIDGSKAASAGYEALGLNAEKMTAQIAKGGPEAEAGLQLVLDKLRATEDPVKRNAAAVGLFGTKAEDMGKALLAMDPSKATQSLGNLAGAAGKAGDALEQSAGAKLESFKRQVQAGLTDALAKAIPYIEATFGWLQKNSGWVQPLAIGLGLLAAAIGVVVAVQTAWNAALALSPVTWIIIGIVAIIAVIVLLATKTQFFQTIWKAVWGFLKAVGSWFAGPFANFFVSAWQKVVGAFNSAKNRVMSVINALKGAWNAYWSTYSKIIGWIVKKGSDMINFFVRMPGRIRSALSNMFSGLWSGFRGVANKIISGWNNLSFKIGGGSVMGVSIPSVTLNTPNIPYLAEGGIVTGPTVAMIGEGRQDEAVIPLDRLPELAGRDDRPIVIEIAPGGEREFRRWINKTVRVKGALRTQGA
jgi:phage-related minor tail protein